MDELLSTVLKRRIIHLLQLWFIVVKTTEELEDCLGFSYQEIIFTEDFS